MALETGLALIRNLEHDATVERLLFGRLDNMSREQADFAELVEGGLVSL